MSLVATQRLKLNGEHYRTGDTLPKMAKAESDALRDQGLARLDVTEADLAAAAQVKAKLDALRAEVAEGEARLAEIAAEVDAAKPVAAKAADLKKAAGEKGATETVKAEAATAAEAQRALDALLKEREALAADVAAKRAALKALG